MPRQITHLACAIGLFFGVAVGCSSTVRDFQPGAAGTAGSTGGSDAMSGGGPNAGSTAVGGGGRAGDASMPDAGAGGDAGSGTVSECAPATKEPCWQSATGVPISSPTPSKLLGNCHFGERVCGTDGKWGECRGAVGPEQKDSCAIAGDDANCDGQANDHCPCVNGNKRACGSNLGSCKQGQQTCTDLVWGDCVGEVKAQTFDSCDNPSDDSNCNGVHDGCACNGSETQACGDCGSQTCAPATRAWGECKPAKPAIACGECGAKACGSNGMYGACIGVVAASCATGTTLKTCKADGSISTQTCYACNNNTCKADPCAGKVCNTPPASVCASPTQFTSYDSTGSCADQGGVGVCSYVSHSSSCTCQGNACNTDPCLGVTCNSPPAASCNGNTLTKYAANGTCSGAAKCGYATTDTVCQFGCSNGACKADPCLGVTCASPPATSCSGTTLTTYPATGTCSGGNCSYAPNNTACPSNKQCGASASCVTCKTDSNCGASCTACGGSSPKCLDQGTSSACVECIADADCSAPGTACQTSSNACLKKNGQSCTSAGQCVSNVCGTYYADVDGDGYGDANSAIRTCGATPPTGYLKDSQDCCDNDPLAFPGQAQYFDVATKCGGFDYNCDGATSKSLTQLAVYTCRLDIGACDFKSEGWGGAIADCGSVTPNWIKGCSYYAPTGTCSISPKVYPSQPVQTCR